MKLIYFTAPWCQPCKTFGPVVDRVVAAHPSLALTKVNVDEDREQANLYGVMGLPTLVLLKDGQPVSGFTGAKSEYQLSDWLRSNT